MAVPRSKSPRPVPPSLKDEKDETFWDKIGTLGRKKRDRAAKEGEYGRQTSTLLIAKPHYYIVFFSARSSRRG